MTGAPSDAQYPMDQPERARHTWCRPTRRVAMYLSARPVLAGPAAAM